MTNNEIFTSILVVQEVSQRLNSILIGNDSVTKEVKREFNIYLKHGEKFRKKWLKQIENIYGSEAAELHEVDADYHYELFCKASKLRTDEQMLKAIATVNNLIK